MNRIIREQRVVELKRWNADTKTMEIRKTCLVEIAIDMDGLFLQLGDAAASNKTGRSVEAGGWVIARVVKEKT